MPRFTGGIVALANARKPVNIVRVAAELDRAGKLPTEEHRSYIAALPDASPSAHNFSYYADALMDLICFPKTGQTAVRGI